MSEPDDRRELQEAMLLASTTEDPNLRRAYEDLAAFYRLKLKDLAGSAKSPDE
jgi:hypothetical protein